MARRLNVKAVKRGMSLLLAIGAPLLVLVWITQVADAQRSDPVEPPPADASQIGEVNWLYPAGNHEVLNVTRIQTATIIPPVELDYSQVKTAWQNDWRDFQGQLKISYPEDVISSELVVIVNPATVTWLISEPVHQVHTWPPAGLEYDVFMAYTTEVGLRFYDPIEGMWLRYGAERYEDSNLVEAHLGGWLTEGYFAFTSTLFFPDPYQFEWASAIPTTILTYTRGLDWIRWSLDDVVSFRGDILLRDVRMRSDLVIDDFYLEPAGPVIVGWPVTVTAVLTNLGDVMPNTYFYTEWYARPLGVGPPAGPDDHDYGWCGDVPECSGTGRLEFVFDGVLSTTDSIYPDPVVETRMRPGAPLTLTQVYTFMEEDTFDLYAQVDVDVEDLCFPGDPCHGRNLEWDEENNVAALGEVQIHVLDFSNSEKRPSVGPTVVGGEVFTYTLVGNSASASTIEERLYVRDLLPNHVTLLTGTLMATTGPAPEYRPEQGTHGMIQWDGLLQPGQSVTITYQVEVDPTTPDGTVFTNSATFNDSAQRTHQQVEAATTVLAPDWSHSYKRVNQDIAHQGGTLSYTLVAKNSGSLTGTITIRDWLPEHGALLTETLTSTGGTPDYDLGALPYGTISWNGDVAPGDAVTITFGVTVTTSTIGALLTNTVCFTDVQRGEVITDVVMTGVDVSPDFGESYKTVDLPTARPGNLLSYQLVGRNQGDGVGMLSLRDPLPEQVALQADTLAATNGAVFYDDGVVGWDGNLAAGEVVTITFQVQLKSNIVEDVVITNTASFINDSTGFLHATSQATTEVLTSYFIYLPLIARQY